MDKVQKTSNMTGERIKEYLLEGKRFDKRSPEEFRELIIEPGISKNAEGSARVKLGKTEVLVGVKMSTSEPYPDSPDKGNLMVTTELLPLSSPRFEAGPPKIESIELGRLIDRAIRESKLIELEKLCIKKGEKVWTVFIDIYSINDDGNLLDASLLGVLKALQEAKFPKIVDDKIDHESKTNSGLKLAKLPILTTVYKINGKLLVDVNTQEEKVIDARLSVSVANGQIHALQKGGDVSFSVDEVKKAVEIATKKEKEMVKFLK